MAEQGLSSKDFREAAAAGTLKRVNGATVEANPLDAVASDARKVLAINSLKSMATTAETEAIKAENESLLARRDNRTLKEMIAEQNGTQGAGGNPVIDRLFGQVGTLQAQLAEAQEKRIAAQQDAVETRLRSLQDEIREARAATPANSSALDKLDEAQATIKQALALADALRPPAPPPARGEGPDPGLRRYELALTAQTEERRLAHDEKRWLLEKDIQLKQEELAREQARRDKEADAQTRFLEVTLPKFLGMLEPLIPALQARLMPTPVAPQVAAQTAAPVASQPPPEIAAPQFAAPPGAQTMTCETCGRPIMYLESFKGVICPWCGAVYTDDTSSTAPAPVVASARGDVRGPLAGAKSAGAIYRSLEPQGALSQEIEPALSAG